MRFLFVDRCCADGFYHFQVADQHDLTPNLTSVRSWARETLASKDWFTTYGHVYIRDEDDTVAFKMRWC